MRDLYAWRSTGFIVCVFLLGIVTFASVHCAASAYAESYFDEASIYNWFVTQQDMTTCDNGKKPVAPSAKGLLESYPENPNAPTADNPSDPNVSCAGFIYDESLAGLVFLSRGDLVRAKRILDFFVNYKNAHPPFDGFSFGFSLNTGEPWLQDPNNPNGPNYSEHRTGDNAWVGIFALEYYFLTKDEKAYDLAKVIANWLTSPVAPSIPAKLKEKNITPFHPGMIPFSPADSNSSLPPYAIFSTEKNLSSIAFLNKFKFFALKRQDPILADNGIDQKIDGIVAFIHDMWDPAKHLFNAGDNFTSSGWILDSNKVLDVNSWFLLVADLDHIVSMTGPDVKVFTDAIEQNFAQNVVNQNLSGFDFAVQSQRPWVKWIEGTNGMTVAYKKLLDLAKFYKAQPYIDYYQAKINQLLDASQADARHKDCFRLSFPYTNSATTIITYPFWNDYPTAMGTSVASSAWAMFSLSGKNPLDFTHGSDGNAIPDSCCAAEKTCNAAR